MTTKDGLGIATQARVEVCTGGRAEGCTPAEVVERQAYVEEAYQAYVGEAYQAYVGEAYQAYVGEAYQGGGGLSSLQAPRWLVQAPRGRPLYRTLPNPISQQHTAKGSVLGVPADTRLRSRVPYPERRMGSLDKSDEADAQARVALR